MLGTLIICLVEKIAEPWRQAGKRGDQGKKTCCAISFAVAEKIGEGHGAMTSLVFATRDIMSGRGAPSLT